MRSRFSFRGVVTTLALAAIGGTMTGLTSVNVAYFAKSRGYDQFVTALFGPTVVAKFGAAMASAAAITSTPTFWIITGVLSGAALVLWIDLALRTRTRRMGYALIICGLGVAALGAFIVWRPSSVSGDSGRSNVDALQSELRATKEELANTKQRLDGLLNPKSPATRLGRIAADSPKSEPKKYTAYEKEQRLRAVDEIYSVLATQLQPTYSEGRKLVYEIYRTVDGSAEQRLTDYANKVQAAFDSLNTLLKKYNYFTDIVQATTKNTFNDVAATHGVKNLVPEIEALRSKAPNDIQWFLLRNTTMSDAINQIGAFERYLKETIPLLQEKRAEIEKAEVYSGQ